MASVCGGGVFFQSEMMQSTEQGEVYLDAMTELFQKHFNKH